MKPRIVSTRILASHFQCTTKTISNLAEQGMPQVERNRWNLDECCKWRREQEVARARATVLDLNRDDEETRLRRAQANLKELELAERTGAVIPIESVEMVWTRILIAVRNKLLSIPTSLTPRLIACKEPDEVRLLLENEITDALQGLSDGDISVKGIKSTIAFGDSPQEASRPAPKTKGVRVGRAVSAPLT